MMIDFNLALFPTPKVFIVALFMIFFKLVGFAFMIKKDFDYMIKMALLAPYIFLKTAF